MTWFPRTRLDKRFTLVSDRISVSSSHDENEPTNALDLTWTGCETADLIELMPRQNCFPSSFTYFV